MSASGIDEELINLAHTSVGGPDPGPPPNGEFAGRNGPDLFIDNPHRWADVRPEYRELGVSGVVWQILVDKLCLLKRLELAKLLFGCPEQDHLGSSLIDELHRDQAFDARRRRLTHDKVRDLLGYRIEDDVT